MLLDRQRQAPAPGGGAWSLNLVALLAFGLGAQLAVGRHATWQAPVENGQMLAGLVPFLPENPYHLYLVKLWSLLNQASALLLWAGCDEVTASLVLGGFAGGIACLALALVTLAVGGSPTMALFAPLAIYAGNLVGEGVGYPIWLMGTSHTYGILGLAWLLLGIGLLGCGRGRAGALAYGLAPAVHPSLGAFGALLYTILFLLRRYAGGVISTRDAVWFVTGISLTLGSLALQLQWAAGGPELPLAEKQQYLAAFMANYDYHRQSGMHVWPGILVAGCTLLLGGIMLRERTIPGGTRCAALALVLTVLLAGGLVLGTLLLPAGLQVLMPKRYLNLANLAWAPLLLGLAVAPWVRHRLLAQGALVVTGLGILLLLWRPELPTVLPYAGGTVVLLGALLLPAGRLPHLPALAGRIAGGSAALALVVWLVVPAVRIVLTGEARSAEVFPDRTNNLFLQTISERPGLLLTAADLHLVPVFTRRPVLLDGGALDFFNYVPETGPSLNAIMRTVYGLDIFVPPPPGHRNTGTITDLHRSLWEQRSSHEWLIIRERFGVTDILAPADWNLHLPVAAQAAGLALFAIAPLAERPEHSLRKGVQP